MEKINEIKIEKESRKVRKNVVQMTVNVNGLTTHTKLVLQTEVCIK